MRKKEKLNFSTNQILIFLVIIIVIILFAGFPISLLFYKNEITFLPSVFISEYAKFLSTLLLALLSFAGINILWKKREAINIEEIAYKDIEYHLLILHRILKDLVRFLIHNFIQENFKSLSSDEKWKKFGSIIEILNSQFLHVDYYIDKLTISLINDKEKRIINEYNQMIRTDLLTYLNEAKNIKSIKVFCDKYFENIKLIENKLDELLSF